MVLYDTARYSTIWYRMVPYVAIRYCIVLYGLVWSCMVLYGPFSPVWSRMVLHGPVWSRMVMCGPAWSQIFPHGPNKMFWLYNENTGCPKKKSTFYCSFNVWLGYHSCRAHWSDTKKIFSIIKTLMMLFMHTKIVCDILSLLKYFCFGTCVSEKKFSLTGSENFCCP